MEKWGVQQRLRLLHSCRPPHSSRRRQEAAGQYLCSPLFFPLLVGAKEAFDFLFLHCLTFTLWALDIWKRPCQTHTHIHAQPHTHAGQAITILCIKQLEGGTLRVKGFLLLCLWNSVSWLIPQSHHFQSRQWLAVTAELFVVCCANIRTRASHLSGENFNTLPKMSTDMCNKNKNPSGNVLL